MSRSTCDVPLATLHIFPLRANGRLLPFLPAPVGSTLMTVLEWQAWRGPKKDEDAQRRGLGLAKANALAATDRRRPIAGNPGL